MNYGQSGRDLLLDLQNREALPAYQATLVRNALQDLRLHVEALQDQVAAARMSEKPPLAVRPSLQLQQAAILRLKRCLLTYHKVRMGRIQAKLTLEPHLIDNEAAWKNLSPVERSFAADYSKLVNRYHQNVLGETPTRVPPSPHDRVQVRVVKGDEAPVVLESGQAVHFQPGATHFLDYRDVHESLQKGEVVLLRGEEGA